MTTMLKHCVLRALEGHNLSADDMTAAVGEIMDGRADPIDMAALLTALRMKGECVDEIYGAALAMKARAVSVPVRRTGLIDTCGTGGDSLSTFNISTAAAIVVSAGGVPVAKHGNRSVSSNCGSADVLEELGVNINLTPEQAGACIERIGLGFCFAVLFHGAMRHAAPVRKQLGFRTIFNLLGPLTNPANAEYQLAGAFRLTEAEKLAHVLARLGRRKAAVVCGAGMLDEVALWGETTAFLVSEESVVREVWTAETFGLATCRVDDLQVSGRSESAAMIRRVLAGERGGPRDMVVANAATALFIAGKADSLPEAAQAAAEVIDSGAAARRLEQLVEMTNA